MEHILQFGVTIDEDAIIKKVEQQAAKAAIDKIQSSINDVMDSRYYEYDNLRKMIKDEIKIVIDKNKDTIIEQAIKELTQNMMRTNAVKDAMREAFK